MSYCVRRVEATARPDFVVFIRFLCQTVAMLPLLGRNVGQLFEWRRTKFHFWRGMLGVAAVVCLYISIEVLPLALATLLVLTSTFWSWVFAGIFLKESLTFRQMVLGGVTVLGIGISVGTSGMEGVWAHNPWGMVAGFFSGVFSGAAITILRKMRQTLPAGEIVFFFGLCGVVSMAPSLVIFPPAQFPDLFPYLVPAGLLATGAQLAMTIGFKQTKAAVGSLCLLLQVPITSMIGNLYLGETPSVFFMAGSMITIVGLMGLMMENQAAKETPLPE